MLCNLTHMQATNLDLEQTERRIVIMRGGTEKGRVMILFNNLFFYKELENGSLNAPGQWERKC